MPALLRRPADERAVGVPRVGLRRGVRRGDDARRRGQGGRVARRRGGRAADEGEGAGAAGQGGEGVRNRRRMREEFQQVRRDRLCAVIPSSVRDMSRRLELNEPLGCY
uniref:Uncharacterized protein n=1 Tax=Oryza brachyantha TaxID=4533 RepID=J3MC02_ORYBR